MSNLYTGILIGAAVSGQFTSTAKIVNNQLRMIGETAGKLSNQKIRLESLGRAEADLEKARARAAAAAAAVNDLRRELNAGPPRKDWSRDFEAAKGASERAAAGVEKARLQLTRADAAFRAAGGAAGGYVANMQKVSTEIERVQARQARLNQYVEAKSSMGEWAASARNSMLGLGLGIAAVSRVIIKPTMDFEDAMLGVAKQVDGARDSSGKLTQVYYDMRSQIQKLGLEIPLSTNELAEMVTAGARMGVAKNELIGFTRTAAKMAEAFEMPAGQLADSMGKIAGLYKIPIPNINELADTINYLDDNAISKGGDIIGFLERTGGVAAGVKVTGQNMAALGSTLLTLGEKTETASTATNAMFQKFAAADKGTKKFKRAMQEIGISTAKVQKGMQQDATGTILMVMDAIGKLPKEKQLGVMVDLVGLEHSDTLAKLANNTGEFRKQIAMANSESAKGSMDKEFKARLGTASAQFKILQNNLGSLATNIGNAVLPAITSMFTSLSGIVGPVAKFAAENQGLVQTLAGMVGGFVAWKAVGVPVIGMIGNIKTAWTVLSMAFTASPIGMILMGIAIAAGAIIANWDTIGPWFKNLWKSVIGFFSGAWERIKSIGSAVAGFFSGIWNTVKTAFSGGIIGVTELLLNWSPLGLLYKAFSKGLSLLGIEMPASLTDLGKKMIGGLVDGITSMGSAVAGFFSGIWDTVKTAFSGGIGGVTELLVNWSPLGLIYQAFSAGMKMLGIELPAKFSDLGKTLINGLVSMWGQATGFFSGIWGQVQAVFQGGIGSIVTLLVNWSPIGLIYRAFSAGMKMLGIELPAKFSDLGKTLINGLVSMWGQATGFFSGIWGQVQAAFQGGIGSIVTLLVNWSPIGLIYRSFSAGMKMLGIELPAKFTDLGKMLINGLVGDLGPKVSAAWTWVRDATTQAWQGMVSTWRQVTGFFSGLWGQVQAAFLGGIGSIAALLVNWSPMGLIYRAFSAGMKMLGIELPGKFTDLGKMLINGLGSMWGKATGFFSGLWGQVQAAFQGGIGSIAALLVNWSPLDLIYQAFSAGMKMLGIELPAKFTDLGKMLINGLVGDLGPKVSAAWTWVRDTTTQAWQGMVSMWGQVTGFFSGIWGQVRAAFQGGIGSIVTLLVNWSPLGLIYQAFSAGMKMLGIELPAKFTYLGKMLINGLVGGIASMGSAVKGAITGIADSTIGWFRDKLGIRSPSRVFMGLGQMVGEGAAQGIGSMGATVGRAAAWLGLAASTAFNPALATDMPARLIASPGAMTTGSMTASAGAAAPVTITQTISITITQQAGEDAEALARKVAARIRRETQSARRAALGDWA